MAQIETFKSRELLPKQDQNLLAKAESALNEAYAPYSKFRVGAAILLSNGVIVEGSNFENASYPLCLCAERVGLAACHSQHPKETVIAIAVAVKNEQKEIDKPASPCGACRQVILEYETRQNSQIAVIMQGEYGKVYRVNSIKDLLPMSFDGSLL